MMISTNQSPAASLRINDTETAEIATFETFIPAALAKNAVNRVADDFAEHQLRNRALADTIEQRCKQVEAETQKYYGDYIASIQAHSREAMALHKATMQRREKEHAASCAAARELENSLRDRIALQTAEYTALLRKNEAEQARLLQQQQDRLAEQARAFAADAAAQRQLEAAEAAQRSQCQQVLHAMLAEVERGALAEARLARRDSSQGHRALQSATASKLAREAAALKVRTACCCSHHTCASCCAVRGAIP
jgi:hypothetical protein